MFTPIKKSSVSEKNSNSSVSDQILKSAKKSSDSVNMTTSSVSDQILTPEKSVHTLLTRSKTRRVALSLKEVKKVALGLQKHLDKTDLASRSEGEKVDDLVSGASLKKARTKENVKLNEKYDELANFFNSMESSIRLLKLKSQAPTYPNISASIQNLTERRFTHKHLAQLKYIFPEAIVIKKVILHDPVTSCMYPDLHVSLQVDAVVDDYSKGKGDTGYSLLRRVLRDRLVDFSKSHPEGDDVPQEELPYPFSQTKPFTETPNKATTPLTMPRIVSASISTSQLELSTSSQKPPRPFKSSFCRKVFVPEDKKTPIACYSTNAPSTENVDAPIASKQTPSPPPKSIPFISLMSPSSPSTLTVKEENKTLATYNSLSMLESKLSKGTPTKALLTRCSLMSNTPEIRSPKRKRDSLDCDSQKSDRRSTRTKLFMTPKKNDTEVDEHDTSNSSSGKNDILDILPASLLQSIRQKERKLKEDRDTGADEAKRRAKLVACLPRTFDMILMMFQTSNRSVLTKEELVYKIIANNSKIVDKDEVEEQLKLLREIVPDWLAEKSSSSFGILYSIDKLARAEELRQRLALANQQGQKSFDKGLHWQSAEVDC